MTTILTQGVQTASTRVWKNLTTGCVVNARQSAQLRGLALHHSPATFSLAKALTIGGTTFATSSIRVLLVSFP